MKQSVFVVEDDPDIARLVVHLLSAEQFQVKPFPNAADVLAEAARHHPALFIIDIMLPGTDGLDLCRRIRQHRALAMTPIIFVTARSGEADRVVGLELGADDYVTKPFSGRELVARVKAVLRRFERPLARSVLKSGDLVVDTGAMVLTVKGKPVPTTATEFRLLEYLVRNAGQVFTRDQLLDAVWRETAYVTPRSVDVYVRKIREKIEADPEKPAYLKTVRGAGYRFEAGK